MRAPQFAGGGHAFAKTPRTVRPEGEPQGAQGRAPLGARSARRRGNARSRRRRDTSTHRRRSRHARCSRSWGKQAAARRRRSATRRRISRRASATSSASRSSARASSKSSAVVWARSLIVSEGALPLVQGRARLMHASQIILDADRLARSRTQGSTRSRYTFKVHSDAHKTQIRQAVEELFDVKVDARQRDQRSGQAEAARRIQGRSARRGRRPSCNCAPATRSRSSREPSSSGSPRDTERRPARYHAAPCRVLGFARAHRPERNLRPCLAWC